MRAVSYIRVSTAEQASSGTSIEDQKAKTRAYIEAKGWALVEEYIDEGVSGSLARRPALDQLMTAARDGDIDVIVTTKLDRFGRSVSHLSTVIPQLEDLGVSFVSIAESIDSTTAAGRLMRNILASFAEFEREQITERMVSGQEAVARAGGSAGGPAPFGYRNVRDDRMTTLEIDEDEANVIRAAVDLVVDHNLSNYEAAARLNALGMAPRKAPQWEHRNLWRILRSKTIAGTWHRGDIEIEIPAVVDPERWDLLQIKLDTASNAQERVHFYPLSGHIVSPCGESMTGLYRRDTKRRYYRCSPNNTRRGERCGCRSISAEDLELVVQEQLTGLLVEPERLLRLAREYLDTRIAEHGAERDQIGDVDDKIATLEKAITTEAGKLLKSGMSASQVRDIISILEDELRELRRHRAQMDAWRDETRSESLAMAGLWQVAEIAHARLGELDDEEWAQVFDLLDIKVEVLKGPTRSTPAQIRIEGVVPELTAVEDRHLETEAPQHPFTEVTVPQPVPFALEVAVA